MNAVDEINDVIEDLFKDLNEKYHKEYTKLYKISRKYKNPNEKLKELMKQSKVFTEVKDLFLVTVDRETIRIMESYLSGISNKMGVSVGRIAYYADFKSINEIYIDNLDQIAIDSINQNMGTVLFDDPKDAYQNVSLALGKSIRQVELMMEEAITTTTRSITKQLYDKIEKDLDKYEIKYKYVGAKDSKNSQFCATWVGKSKTMKEWKIIKSDIFVRGGHYKCRHSMDIQPVSTKDIK